MVADMLARTVNRLIADHSADTDADLLRQFVVDRDESAFTLLVRRHGPMVFGVCRRTLGHQHDAEDAFQATFLVFARKAHTVRPDGVGGWLYRVAVRVANKARVRRARQSIDSANLDQLPDGSAHSPNIDWLPLIDAALARMSAHEREPILLCDVLGRSRTEAAAELGLAEGTLSSRLARARGKLRAKLTRLGVVPSALTIVALVPEPVPAALIDITKTAASTAARQLAEGVLRTMAITKITQLTALSLCILGTVTMGIVMVPGAGAGPTPAAKDTLKEPPSKEAVKPTRSDAERFKGAWTIESATRSGANTPVNDWQGEQVTFDGTAVRFNRFPGRQKTYQLDPGWDQKHIDFTFTDVPSGLGKVTAHIPAIYRFEGDKLHMVLGVVDLDERPESFERSDKQPPFTHVLLKRGIDAPDPTADERKALQGTWVLTAVEMNGERRETKGTNLVFFGDHIMMQPIVERIPVIEANYTLDISTTPRQIDIRITAGAPTSVGKKMTGIYVRDKGLLKLRLNEDGRDRPTSIIDSTNGPPIMYFILEGSGAKLPEEFVSKVASGRLRDLQKARVQALEEQMQEALERVKIGKDPLNRFIDLIRELAEAKLELAETKEAKITAVEQWVSDLTTCEEQLVKLHEAGLQTRAGVSQARAARLKAEIELERLKLQK